jgi:hypothetical protein
MTDEEFQENLRLGTAAEDKVYSYLRMNYSFIQDMRYQKHEKGTGPRLEGTTGSLILPDFAFYDRYKGKGLLDVKYKASKFFTVDDYKYRDYLECTGIMNLATLLLVFVYEDEMYFYDSNEATGPRTFNNSYGKAAYVFEYNRSKIKK